MHLRRVTRARIFARSRSRRLPVALPYPNLELPLQITGSQYAPVAWSDIAGWSEDDHLAAYKAFRVSCRPIAAQTQAPAETKALGASLRDPCRIAKGLELSDGARAKAFFEEQFHAAADLAARRRRGVRHRLL